MSTDVGSPTGGSLTEESEEESVLSRPRVTVFLAKDEVAESVSGEESGLVDQSHPGSQVVVRSGKYTGGSGVP